MILAKLAVRLIAAAALLAPLGAAQAADWPTATPAQAGMDPAIVAEALAYAGAHNSTGVVVVKGGKIVAEQYWQGWGEHRSESIYSSSKSITSTLVGLAIQDGFIRSVDQSASDFVPQWKGTPKEAITIRHMLSMSSGLKVIQAAGPGVAGDIFADAAAAPLEHAPGTHWAYNTPVYRMLVRIVEIATREPAQSYMERRLLKPLGMADTRWLTSPTPSGGLNYFFIAASPRDMARFGLLAARKGRWNGKPVVPAAWFAEATKRSQEMNQAYGYLWWLNGQPSRLAPGGRGGVIEGQMWPQCPPDMFAALGAQDKKIYVVPSLDLVVVRHGGSAGGNAADSAAMRGGLDTAFMGRLCQAVKK